MSGRDSKIVSSARREKAETTNGRPMELPANSLALRRHDVFNLLALSLVVAMDVFYLRSTSGDLEKLGTSEVIGSAHLFEFHISTSFFLTYLLADCLWIWAVPGCTSASPASIIVHHAICAINFCLPLYDARWAWFAVAIRSAEANTVVLLLRRLSPQGSWTYRALDALFYATWVAFRLALFPVMTYVLWDEYLRFSATAGTFVNVVAVGPVMQALLTAMSYGWTYELLTKNRKAKTAEKKK